MLPQTACTAIRYTLQRIARENKSAARATADLANIVPYTETSPASIAAACVHFESYNMFHVSSVSEILT